MNFLIRVKKGGICSENLSDKSSLLFSHKNPNQKHCNYLQFEKQFRKRKIIIRTTNIDLSPISLCTNTNQNPGRMHVNRAPLIIHVSSFFFPPSANHARCLPSTTPACQGMQKRGGKRGIFAVKLRKLRM